MGKITEKLKLEMEVQHLFVRRRKKAVGLQLSGLVIHSDIASHTSVHKNLCLTFDIHRTKFYRN